MRAEPCRARRSNIVTANVSDACVEAKVCRSGAGRRSRFAAVAQATFHTAPDGLPARDAASWTEEKLMILDAYLNAFAKACRSAGGWYALDLFAGTGLNWSTTRDREIRGSALIALEAGSPEATKIILAEKHPGAFDALRHRTEAYGK